MHDRARCGGWVVCVGKKEIHCQMLTNKLYLPHFGKCLCIYRQLIVWLIDNFAYIFIQYRLITKAYKV